MPKAKFKRKGVPELSVPSKKSKYSEITNLDSSLTEKTLEIPEDVAGFPVSLGIPCSTPVSEVPGATSYRTLLDLPEELICLILVRLPVSSISNLEITCKHLQRVLVNARIWRKILLHKLEFEPGLRILLPPSYSTKMENRLDLDHKSCKKLLENLKLKVDYAWLNTNAPTVIRSDKVFGQTLENHVLCQIMTSGRYFAAFYGTICKSKENYEIDIIDIFDRSSGERVRRLDSMPAKPDILRIVEELGVFLLSYPGLLSLEINRLGQDESKFLVLCKPGETESGSVCDIVVRDYITIRGVLHRRAIMVAMNTEPLGNPHYHIGELQFYSLSEQGEVGSTPLCSLRFNPVPIKEGRFFNQCIQKKGLSDFNDDHAVVVVGGCEGSAVLGVVNLQEERLVHKLQLKSPGRVGGGAGGCEGGLCQYSVVSLMIDRIHTDTCSILLSTGQLIVIHLASGTTIFHRHLQFDGQLKLALHQPGLLGKQRIGIKFRNYVTFYDLILSARGSEIDLKHIRTLRITSIDADGRETRLDDNPSQELRRQFGELQKRVRALNQYTSGIQKKLDKGLRPGTVTQGVHSMTQKVHLVTSKLDQAHGKAREIEAVVIASIAFDNRFCHALTLNRDLVSFDLEGTLDVSENSSKLKDLKGKYVKSLDDNAPSRSTRKTREKDEEPVPGSSRQNRRR